MWNQCIGALSEDAREPRLAITFDGNAKDSMAGTARLSHGHVAILDAVAPFVMIEVVGFAIGDYQKQAALAWFSCEACRSMADCSTQASVETGLQASNPLFYEARHGLSEILRALDVDTVALQ